MQNVFRRRGKFDEDLIMNKAESKVEKKPFDLPIADLLCRYPNNKSFVDTVCYEIALSMDRRYL
jgi:hypothetical protein